MNNRNVSQKGGLDFLLFFILALLWSGSFINIKVVVDALPPIFCALMRVLLSLFFLVLFFTWQRKKIFSAPAKCWHLWVAGFFTQALPFCFLFMGEKYLAPALASIINSTVSIWSLILGTLIFRDFSQWTPIKVGGIVLGFIGIILVFAPFLHGRESSWLGFCSVLIMALSYAVGGLLNQHVIFKNSQIRFETNLLQQHLASIFFLTATSLSLETWPTFSAIFHGKIIFSFLYLGLMATALAWIIYFYLIREWGAVRAASVMYLVPVLAIVWDFLFLHFIPAGSELLGVTAILTGVTLIQRTRKPKAIRFEQSTAADALNS